jgi:hypothetical protein
MDADKQHNYDDAIKEAFLDSQDGFDRIMNGKHPINDAPYDESPLDFVIYSPNESALGNGFWSNEEAWVELPQATRFTKDEKNQLTLPISTGQDAQWVLFEEATMSYGDEVKRSQMENLTSAK